jgi:hypothetical protein
MRFLKKYSETLGALFQKKRPKTLDAFSKKALKNARRFSKKVLKNARRFSKKCSKTLDTLFCYF